MSKHSDQAQSNVLEHILAGSSAGIIGTLLGYPLDSCKVRMQTDTSGYPSLRRTFSRIGREEGVFGFYRGVGAPLTALTILNTMSFAIFAKAKEIVGLSDDPVEHFDPRITLASLMIAPVTSFVSTPFELLKTQMVMRPHDYPNANFLQTARSIVCTHGARSLYRAHLLNFARESIFLATYFTSYEHIKGLSEFYIPATVAIPVAGGLAGAAAWFVSYPLDLIKGNLQSQSLSEARSAKRLRFWDLAKDLIRSRGIVGFYSGVTPSIIRAFLVSSSRFGAYETTLWLLKTFQHSYLLIFIYLLVLLLLFF